MMDDVRWAMSDGSKGKGAPTLPPLGGTPACNLVHCDPP